MRKVDLTGQRFGRLTVLEDIGRKWGTILWKCQCSCGKIVEIPTCSLRTGNTQSCGCLHNDRLSKASYIDLTGQQFGRLSVLKDAGRTPQSKVRWQCQCKCGAIVTVEASALKGGTTQSCGCLHKERVSKLQYKNVIGQKFGRLTALEDVGRTPTKQTIWKCICECGNIVNVRAGQLQNGGTKSCGCLHKDRTSETHAKEKHPNWKGGITDTYTTIRTCVAYKNWRFSVFKRDSFTCQKCNQLRGNINAHHIVPFSTIMEEHNITTLVEAEACEALWDVSNGITLCKKCHRKEHKKKT